jgi:preprotein translocase subunit SecA
MAVLSEAKLRERAAELRELFRLGRERAEDLVSAYALVCEVAGRELGEVPFQCQVAGALGLHEGRVVEMATGEGKTLAATMPATVAGWRGKGCHVVTTNDYLAARDTEWMGPVYRFCGLRVANVEQGMLPPDRRAAYDADITYCTNKEVTADFLRDRLAAGRLRSPGSALLAEITGGPAAGLVMRRGLQCAVVDEADSILIDEAVTPLIISSDAPNPDQAEAFVQAAGMASELEPGRHYRVNRRYREVGLTRAGLARVAAAGAQLGGIWGGMRRSEELVVQALTARELYGRGEQYVVEDGKVVIVDEFTGRLMPDRTWRHGLHQAVEAKEGLEVNLPKDVHARISFQRFFRLYRSLAGMTGTAAESWLELWRVYHMPVVVIPTNRPCVRRRLPQRVFATAQARWAAVTDEIRREHELGRPVLVGTRSVAASEHLSRLLRAEGIAHNVLNATRHAEEARIVAEAGGAGRVTVATNMAGRGTDIKLGRGVAGAGGLHVIATERHEAGRIDRQLFGRSGRQGDPGSARAIVSLEDELVRRYAPHLSGSLRTRYAGTAQEVSGVATRALFGHAQRRAERLAGRRRQAVLRTDDWLDEFLGFAGREH